MSTTHVELEANSDSLIMAPMLRQFVEQRLIEDLRYYKISNTNLHFDWSKSCGEGHSCEYLDGILENFSYLAVCETNNLIIAEGNLYFLDNFWDNTAEKEVIIFWNFVNTFNGGKILAGKFDPGIPDHIWKKLDESLKGIWKDYRQRKNPFRFL